jgi:hypothetical protein
MTGDPYRAYCAIHRFPFTGSISCILRSKFALKFMLTKLVFEIKEGKKCTKSKKEY